MSIDSFTRRPIPQLEDRYSELIDSSVRDVIPENTYEIPDPTALQGVFEYARDRTGLYNKDAAPTSDELAQFAVTSFSSAMQALEYQSILNMIYGASGVRLIFQMATSRK